LIAGIDEAGRGPLAGPVVAAAVILPQDVFIEGLNDSKKLTENQREKLFDVINDKAIGAGIGIVDEKQIDEINILNATKKAMKLAVGNLKPVPDILFIDSLKLDDINIEQNSIVKGDAKSVSIAAASIIAKVTRDRILREMDKKYPMYGFARHKGYGTGEHIEAYFINLVIVNFREYKLFFYTQGIISSSVKRIYRNTSKVPYSWQGNIYELVGKFIHLVSSQCYFATDAHSLSYLKSGN